MHNGGYTKVFTVVVVENDVMKAVKDFENFFQAVEHCRVLKEDGFTVPSVIERYVVE